MYQEQKSKFLKESVKEHEEHESPREIKSEGLMSRNSVADLLGISISTLDNWCRAGLIERVKVGRAVRYTPESIRNFIEEYNQKRM